MTSPGSRKDGPDSNLCRNLRAVVDRAASVAEFCRLVGINRQQFNKYLAGTHMPSRRSMIKIADHCGLGTHDFLLQQDMFEARLGEPNSHSNTRRLTDHFQTLETFARSSAILLKPFLGTYFRYHHCSIYDGFITRAVTVIYQDADIVRYVTMERFQRADGDHNERHGFSYRGICYLMGSRVFMCDYENKQLNELTSTILMPQYRTPIRYMFGLLTGVAATAYGQPFSARAAFVRHSDDRRLRRDVIRQATLMKPDDTRIPASVRDYIGMDRGSLLMATT